MKQPLLSVVIATKDREEYCIASIDSILALNDDRIQIAVADNSATEKIKNFVTQLNHPAVDYIYDGGGVSFIENYNRATELAKGEFIIMLGDDDTILPNCVELAALMKDKGVDAISSNIYVEYFWPGTQASGKGLLLIPRFSKTLKQINNKKNLEALLKGGILEYHSYDLPKLYHGIVRKSKLDEVKQKVGSYYRGLSPDIYSAVALAMVIDKGYIWDFPLSIAGVCKASASFHEDKRAHCGSLADMPHLKFRKEPYKWNDIVPRFNSGYTVWANSALDAIADFGKHDLIRHFDHFKFYRRLNSIYPQILPEIFPQALEDTRLFLGIDKQTFNQELNKTDKISKLKGLLSIPNRIIRKLRSFSNTPQSRFDDIRDIKEAVVQVTKTLDLSYQPNF